MFENSILNQTGECLKIKGNVKSKDKFPRAIYEKTNSTIRNGNSIPLGWHGIEKENV